MTRPAPHVQAFRVECRCGWGRPLEGAGFLPDAMLEVEAHLAKAHPGRARLSIVMQLDAAPATHQADCEADIGHRHDCATATELARLRAFAEAVRDEFPCTDEDTEADGHTDDCWHCAAEQALERVR